MRAIALLSLLLVAAVPSFAETADPNAEVELLREQIRGGKTEVISNVLNISDAAQAARFWTLYRDYEGKLQQIGDKRLALIEDYLKSYSTMNNEIAATLMDRALENQEDLLALRKEFAKKISKEVSPIVAARFLQVDGFIQKYLDLQVDGKLPLLTESQEAVREKKQG